MPTMTVNLLTIQLISRLPQEVKIKHVNSNHIETYAPLRVLMLRI